MADVTLGKKKNLLKVGAAEEVEVLNGTDTVKLIFVDDYSKLGLEVTTAAGVTTVYEVSLTER
jgi:hypothetical protein